MNMQRQYQSLYYAQYSRACCVVGYQNKTIAGPEVGGYTWTLSTLPSVGANKSELVIDSWKIVSPKGGLISEYSIRMNTFGSDGQISGDYVYLDDVTSATYGCEPGWYTTVSIEEWNPDPAGSIVLPFGEGVQIGSDCGATVVFAGEVPAVDMSFTVAGPEVGGYTWTGNATPVNLKLEDFTITSPEGGLISEYSIRVNTFGSDGQISGDYVYLDNVTSATYGCEPGWYTTVSIEEWSPVYAGKVDIVSGEMFQIGSDCGATITVPSAL